MNNHSHNFVFKYNKKGGISGENQTILFNSDTKQIEIRSRSSPPRRTILSEEEEHRLLDAFESANFFKLENYYLPLEGTDSILYVVIAFKENALNSCIWSDGSQDVPPSLINLTETMENLLKF
jgi:hypothetical protein